MDKNLRQQIEQWYNDNEHQLIVDAIHSIPRSEWDYEMVSQLVRAHNNLEEFDKAYELSMSIADEGAQDALWHYRHAYTLFYMSDTTMDKAREEAEKALSLTDDEEIRGFIT